MNDIENDDKDSNMMNKIISSIEKMIDSGQKRVKKSIDVIKNNKILNIDWLDILSLLSHPISLDFLI
ncbi:MAG: hypothetical protein EU549_02720, partial [Promethearchaeota archaeon]